MTSLVYYYELRSTVATQHAAEGHAINACTDSLRSTSVVSHRDTTLTSTQFSECDHENSLADG